MADLSKLSANILASLKAIAAGDGKNKNTIDSAQEFNELSRLLSNCENQEDYDCLLGLKLDYQNKLEKNANSIAKEFYQIADDNSGNSSMSKMSDLLNKKVNANNIIAVLNAYDKAENRKDDSSIIDTVTSEVGASSSKQREVLTKIINTLCEAAKNAGVSESDITNARNAFITSMEKEFGAHFRRTNPKDMEKAVNFLRGAILAKQNEVKNVSEDSAMQSVAQGYQQENAAANEEFEKARKEEGWTAKTGDWVCGLFGCNTEDELRAKLGKNAEKVDKLVKAANSRNKEEFKKVYKELFGIEFDANKVAAAEEYTEKFEAAQSMDFMAKTMDEVLAQKDKLDYNGIINLLKEKLQYDDETINQILTQYSQELNQPIETNEQKQEILEYFLNSTKENYTSQLKFLLEGETLEQMANKAELLAKAAYGTNDIAKDITQFNENMVMTEMMTDAAFEIAGTIALQLVPGLGQAAAVKLAASAARWGAKGYKIAQGAIKIGKGFRATNKFLQGQKFTSKYAQKGMQIGTQMGNAGVATATVETTSGKDLETVVKKTLMNMSFAGVGATSSMIAPKLVQSLGISNQLATEIAEELINTAGSYGVCTAAGDEYGSTDFWTDMATGIVMSRIAHIKGGKKGDVETSHSNETHNSQRIIHENDQINHITQIDEGIPFIPIHKNILDKLEQANTREDFRNVLKEINSIPKSESGDLFDAYLEKYRKWSTTQPDVRMQLDETQGINGRKKTSIHGKREVTYEYNYYSSFRNADGTLFSGNKRQREIRNLIDKIKKGEIQIQNLTDTQILDIWSWRMYDNPLAEFQELQQAFVQKFNNLCQRHSISFSENDVFLRTISCTIDIDGAFSLGKPSAIPNSNMPNWPAAAARCTFKTEEDIIAAVSARVKDDKLHDIASKGLDIKNSQIENSTLFIIQPTHNNQMSGFDWSQIGNVEMSGFGSSAFRKELIPNSNGLSSEVNFSGDLKFQQTPNKAKIIKPLQIEVDGKTYNFNLEIIYITPII